MGILFEALLQQGRTTEAREYALSLIQARDFHHDAYAVISAMDLVSRAEQLGGQASAAVEWATEATVVELVPNERFFFDCSVRDFVFSKWGYTIEPAPGGCLVTELAQDLRPASALERSASISGVSDRLSHNRAGMEATLARLAAVLE